MRQEADVVAETVAGLLGIRKAGNSSPSTLEIIDAIQKGLPVKTLHRISSHVAPDDANFKYQIVPKATLARRNKPGGRLSASESDRLERLATVWALALDVWHEQEGARAFLFRPHPLLNGRKPMAVLLGTDRGGRLVEDILGRLKYGSAA